MDYRDIEWFALDMNRDHSVIFEIASKYCILDSFVDCDGYSISSMGFLPTVVGQAQLFSHVQFFATLWTVVCQAPLSMKTLQQEYWSSISVLE